MIGIIGAIAGTAAFVTAAGTVVHQLWGDYQATVKTAAEQVTQERDRLQRLVGFKLGRWDDLSEEEPGKAQTRELNDHKFMNLPAQSVACTYNGNRPAVIEGKRSLNVKITATADKGIRLLVRPIVDPPLERKQ